MGTVKVTNIEPIADNGTVTLGSSGDNLVIGSGAVPKFMYPAFEAELTSDQSVSDATITVIQYDQENLDTDSCYDNSTNYRFTPTVAGKYYVYASTNLRGSSSNTVTATVLYLYKNGSQIGSHVYENQSINVRSQSHTITQIVDMNGSTDYIDARGYIDVTSGSPVVKANDRSIFGAYRIGG